MDPINQTKLSTVMKSQMGKSKSPVNLSSKLSIKSPIGQKLLNLTTSQARLKGMSRQAGSSRLDRLPRGANSSHLSHNTIEEDECRLKKDISILDSSKKRVTCPSIKPITPKIMITKCSRLEKLVEEKDPVKNKKVLRSNVRSPGLKFGVRCKEHGCKTLNNKIAELDSQLRKKNSENLNLNRKFNSIQKTVNDKEKVIKNLESKFPKMLSDLKKGLNDERKANVELKETIKRNKQLFGDKKHTEDMLKLKDEKLKDVMAVKKTLIEDLNKKDLELNEFRQRLSRLETKIPDLLSQVQAKDAQLLKCKETIDFQEQRLVFQSEENNYQVELIEEMKEQIIELSNDILVKENEIIDLKADNNELHTELVEQYQNLERTDQETKKYLELIDNIRGNIESAPLDVKSVHDSIGCLDKATEDYLDKVSTVSRDRNLSLNLKLTLRKTRGGSPVDQSYGNVESFLLNPVILNNNNTTSLSLSNSLRNSSRSLGNCILKSISKANSRNVCTSVGGGALTQ